MSTTRILFLSALIFAYHFRWLLASVAAAAFGALWAARVGVQMSRMDWLIFTLVMFLLGFINGGLINCGGGNKK